MGDPVPAGIDLFYIGGGQDREQGLVAPDLRGEGVRRWPRPSTGGAVVLAVCGGYQLLGRSYRDVSGSELPGIGLLPLADGRGLAADDRRRPARLRLGRPSTLAGFENHAGRTILDPGAEPLGRVVSGFGNDGTSGAEGCRSGRVYGTYLHGPLLPRNPWFADRVLAEALAHATGGEPEELEPLADELELEAHAVSAARARCARRPQ